MTRMIFALITITLLAACAPSVSTVTEAPPTETKTAPTAAAIVPTDAPDVECVPDEGTEVDEASVLVPGPINGVAASTAVGERLVVVVTVLLADCQPAEGASVDVWHTDAEGLYAPEGSTQECCMFGGTVVSDAAGRFRLDTIRPAGYKDQRAAAHIHMEITHPVADLMTEILFEGDPNLSIPNVTGGDFQAVAIALAEQTDEAGAYWFGRATFTLGGR